MQDRYAGDVGDFVKLGLLRSIFPGYSLGLGWYRYPDEAHNDDGRHIGYLNRPHLYANLDPELFEHLRRIVLEERSIASLLPVLPGAVSYSVALDSESTPSKQRRRYRMEWFSRMIAELEGCNLVFADPDNGIVDDAEHRKGQLRFGKQMPLNEVKVLARGRCAVIYHHNTRRVGGHDLEVDYWLREIAMPAMAVRATAHSPRTFFIVNPDVQIKERVSEFCERWRILKVRLHT